MGEVINTPSGEPRPLLTPVYRGKQIGITSFIVEEQKTESYYPVRRYRFAKLIIADVHGGQPPLAFTDLAFGSRSGRWDSWTAWDSCGFFALLGDFVLYCVTAPAVMDPSDGHYKLKTIYLVDPATVQHDAEDITSSMQLLHNFEDDEDNEVDLAREFISLNQWTMHANTGAVSFMQSTFSAGVHAPEGGEIAFDSSKVSACGGAARVTVNSRKRWLVPHPDGPSAALARVLETTPVDDWTALTPYLENATSCERDRVRSHFLGLQDSALAAEVVATLGSAGTAER